MGEQVKRVDPLKDVRPGRQFKRDGWEARSLFTVDRVEGHIAHGHFEGRLAESDAYEVAQLTGGRQWYSVSDTPAEPSPGVVLGEGRFPPQAGDVWGHLRWQWEFNGRKQNGYWKCRRVDEIEKRPAFLGGWPDADFTNGKLTFVRYGTPTPQPAPAAGLESGYYDSPRCREMLVSGGLCQRVRGHGGHCSLDGYSKPDPQSNPRPAQALGYTPGSPKTYAELLREAREADGVPLEGVKRRDVYREHKRSLGQRGVEPGEGAIISRIASPCCLTAEGGACAKHKAEPWRAGVDDFDLLPAWDEFGTAVPK